MEKIQQAHREIWIDWMRVLACLMVMLVHATEPFYLGGEGTLLLTESDAFWVSFFDSFARACVPLFVVASSYLQFPLHYSTSEFMRRRAVRVLIPFFVWSLVYALIWGDPIQNLQDLLLNFNYAAGHLWFVYMLIGLYLLMPLLSPWAERVSKRELEFYLSICFFTTLIPFVRAWASGGSTPVVYGPSGIPNAAEYPLWGVASWNAYGLFYYLSGFMGYLLLGLYLRRFVNLWSWGKTLRIALPCWLLGFAIAFLGFLKGVQADAVNGFPIEGPTGIAALWEIPLINDSAGVFLMTVGWILLFRKLSVSGWFYDHILLPISKASYGMYLCHMALLALISGWLREAFGLGLQGEFGIFTTPTQILLTAILTFSMTALFCTILQCIPKIGKWIVG